MLRDYVSGDDSEYWGMWGFRDGEDSGCDTPSDNGSEDLAVST
jgi:hypothetical protein